MEGAESHINGLSALFDRLSAIDFLLFDYIKFRLNDLPDAQSLWKEITKNAVNIPQSEFLKSFRNGRQKWLNKERNFV